MQGKEIIPKREKNTKISFPLINPEPIAVPTIARKADIQFFIKIFYYFKREIRIKKKKVKFG